MRTPRTKRTSSSPSSPSKGTSLPPLPPTPLTSPRGQKLVVGTQLGVLSVFNRARGYGDCVDRIPGHPPSIDALCAVPARYPGAAATVLTGSSDGLLRAVQVLPTRLLGVVADHGEFPIERIAVDRAGEGRWVGSVGHDEVLKMTDLKEVFEDDGAEDEDEEDEGDEEDESGADGEAQEEEPTKDDSESEAEPEEQPEAEGADSSDDEGEAEKRKRKRKKEKDPFQATKKAKARNEMEATDASFFADL